MQFTISLKSFFFTFVLIPWKRKKNQISIQFHFKKKKKSISNFFLIAWATLLTLNSYEPHGTYLSGSTNLLHLEGPKKQQLNLSLLSRGWNPLLGACSDLDIKTRQKTCVNLFSTFLHSLHSLEKISLEVRRLL